MRKLILMTVLSLSLFSVLAFSQEVLPADAAASSSVESSPAPTTKAESAAKTFGHWMGRMVRTPVNVVKSLAQGVKEGASSSPATPKVAVASASAAIPAPAASAATMPVMTMASNEVPASSSLLANMRDKLASLRTAALTKVIGTQAPAPVEDRSIRNSVAVN